MAGGRGDGDEVVLIAEFERWQVPVILRRLLDIEREILGQSHRLETRQRRVQRRITVQLGVLAYDPQIGRKLITQDEAQRCRTTVGGCRSLVAHLDGRRAD